MNHSTLENPISFSPKEALHLPHSIAWSDSLFVAASSWRKAK